MKMKASIFLQLYILLLLNMIKIVSPCSCFGCCGSNERTPDNAAVNVEMGVVGEILSGNRKEQIPSKIQTIVVRPDEAHDPLAHKIVETKGFF